MGKQGMYANSCTGGWVRAGTYRASCALGVGLRSGLAPDRIDPLPSYDLSSLSTRYALRALPASSFSRDPQYPTSLQVSLCALYPPVSSKPALS